MAVDDTRSKANFPNILFVHGRGCLGPELLMRSRTHVMCSGLYEESLGLSLENDRQSTLKLGYVAMSGFFSLRLLGR